MLTLKAIREILAKNFGSIVKFELGFKLVTLLIMMPVFLNIFKLIMKITGYHYLTLENVWLFLLNPLTMIMLLLFLLMVGFYAIFDIGTIIILLDAARQGRKIKLKDAMILSLKESLGIFKLRNFGLLILVLLILPFLNLGMRSAMISTIRVPEFIMEFIMQNYFLAGLYWAAVVVLIILVLRWLYALHYYFLEGKSFNKACKSSAKLARGNHLKDVLYFALVQCIMIVSYLLYIVAGVFLIMLVNQMLNRHLVIESVLISLLMGGILISLVIFSLAGRLLSYVCISVLFYEHKKEKDEPIIHVHVKDTDKDITKQGWNLLKFGFVLLGFVGLTTFVYGVVKGDYNLNIEHVRTMEITAHRGASADYPENTMAAFIGAKELGADWIELDVQQTKDGQIVVLHDANLKRVAGVDLNVYDATYDEISDLDVGSYKDARFAGEKVPLLEDVIKWAKANQMRLNIELKPTGYETDIEKRVVDLIRKYNFANECMVSSLFYNMLEKVKEIDPDITTVYVLSLAFGDVTELAAADYFSIEATSITKEMVSRVHAAGKQILGWTVNTEEGIEKMIRLNVDNIVTDKIALGKDLVAKSRTGNLIMEVVNFIQMTFR